LATLTLLIVYRVPSLRNYQTAALSGMVIFAGLFMVSTLGTHPLGTAFLNTVAIERLTSAALVLIAWLVTRRQQHSLAPLFGWIAAVELVNTIAVELYRWNFDSWAILLHGMAIAAVLSIVVVARYRVVPKFWVWLMMSLMAVTALWALGDRNSISAMILMVIAPLSLIALSLRTDVHDDDYVSSDRVCSVILTPVMALLWAKMVSPQETLHFALSIAAFYGLTALILMRVFAARCERWIDSTTPLFIAMFGGALFLSTVVSIHRGVWPVMLELMCLAGCGVLFYSAERGQRFMKSIYIVTTVGSVLFAQALLLRALGPDRVMSLLDVFNLHYPAVISLFWSVLGAGLTLLARKIQSRPLWSMGAAVLVACAAKLLLFDFGSFGELTNILAVIASGLVFLGVSWLAPLPPKAEEA
jgi:hypothetical protein